MKTPSDFLLNKETKISNSKRERERQRETDRQRQREAGGERDGDGGRDRDGRRDRDGDREREREREGQIGEGYWPFCLAAATASAAISKSASLMQSNLKQNIKT